MDKYNTIIIGSGVAGMTAALYLKRACINTLVIEKESPGGQITKTSKIDNYPGYISIEGVDLALNIFNQLTNIDVPYSFSKVVKIEKQENGYLVTTTDNSYLTDNIIIAVGRTPRKLQVPNEKELSGKGISWCAVCDGPLYKNKDVCVIGGGAAALEETIYLSKICSNVTLIHRRDKFRANKETLNEVKSLPNVNILTNTTIKSFISTNNKLSAVIINNNGKEESLPIDGCFEFIGQVPNTSSFKDLNILDDEGYVEVDNNYQTNLKNIYACGDCVKKDLYQIIVASSEGAIVANKIIKKA